MCFKRLGELPEREKRFLSKGFNRERGGRGIFYRSQRLLLGLFLISGLCGDYD